MLDDSFEKIAFLQVVELALLIKPVGKISTWSPWLIHTISFWFKPLVNLHGFVITISVLPYSFLSHDTTFPLFLCAINWAP